MEPMEPKSLGFGDSAPEIRFRSLPRPQVLESDPNRCRANVGRSIALRAGSHLSVRLERDGTGWNLAGNCHKPVTVRLLAGV
jgi:hypothetical protein